MFSALAAPGVFRTVRENDPTLPTVLSVNLDGQHSTLLAGQIVMQFLRLLSRVGLVCGVVLFLSIVAQFVLIPSRGSNFINAVVRTALYLVCVAMTIYDWRVVSPKLVHFRQHYIDNADNPDIANDARDQFDKTQRESVNVLFVLTLALMGLILFSASIVPFTVSAD